MTTATVETITTARAEGFYANVMDKIRDRHDKPERWDMAVAHVVMGMSDFDVQVVFAYLKTKGGFAEVDRLLMDALAKRLGLVIEWNRVELM
jgi:hypothetical protein